MLIAVRRCILFQSFSSGVGGGLLRTLRSLECLQFCHQRSDILILRLFILPALLIASIYGIKTLANSLFNLSIGHDVLFLCFFATATPLGMNTIVFPEAYGGDPKTGASMALVSHTLCVISIPIMYAIMVSLFGAPFGT